MTPEERVATFEPCRAVLRPRQCDEREGCWVKVGAPGFNGQDKGRKCVACNGRIRVAGLEHAHAQAVFRCSGIEP